MKDHRSNPLNVGASPKRSLTHKFGKIASALLLTTQIFAGSAAAGVEPRISILDRAAAVRKAATERLANNSGNENLQPPAELPHALAQLAQWGNWQNWNNWVNWKKPWYNIWYSITQLFFNAARTIAVAVTR